MAYHGSKHTTVVDHSIFHNRALKLMFRLIVCHDEREQKLSGTSLSIHVYYHGLKHTTVVDHKVS